MERHPPLPMTPFDEKVSSQQLHTMKLLLPYFPAALQRMLSFYIKFTELQNTLHFIYHLREEQTEQQSFSDMFQQLRPYLHPNDSASIDSILSILNMVEMMQTMNMDSMPDLSGFGDFSDMMDLFNSAPPENDQTKKEGNVYE